ncbi:hypothetical protein ACFRQM_47195 [Streptomyces sp. NPDC056831]|uniref:hypothetical protein n=1 Tax=Streptomyces sp. NPDC056831 TaxID=3345954 RepID=UPI0036BFB032
MSTPREGLDASSITLADSVFLQIVIAAHQRRPLYRALPAVALLFQLVGVDAFLRFYPSVEEALTG